MVTEFPAIHRPASLSVKLLIPNLEKCFELKAPETQAKDRSLCFSWLPLRPSNGLTLILTDEGESEEADNDRSRTRVAPLTPFPVLSVGPRACVGCNRARGVFWVEFLHTWLSLPQYLVHSRVACHLALVPLVQLAHVDRPLRPQVRGQQSGIEKHTFPDDSHRPLVLITRSSPLEQVRRNRKTSHPHTWGYRHPWPRPVRLEAYGCGPTRIQEPIVVAVKCPMTSRSVFLRVTIQRNSETSSAFVYISAELPHWNNTAIPDWVKLNTNFSLRVSVCLLLWSEGHWSQSKTYSGTKKAPSFSVAKHL